ncbi:MAG: hypothetical protein LC754_07550 [Acidobacteria bacterium]|nr:hypothetical protein [Acidobacteriota bacterium]
MKHLFSGAVILLLLACTTAHAQVVGAKMFLRDGWGVQSSQKTGARGEEISRAGFKTPGWYPTRVPSTVVATLVENKALPDPFYGMNLRTYPGCSYPIGFNFSKMEMPEGSPYRASWWYRTEFRAPVTKRGRRMWLNFDGINFRANVWLNGQRIAASDEIAGTFRRYALDITDAARPGQVNALAVEVFAPAWADLAYTWVDWNPAPPDKNMGLWQDVYVTTSGAVTVRYPQAVTHFDSDTLDVAHLTVNAEVSNATGVEVAGTVRGRIEGITFDQPVTLAPHETKTVTFAPDKFRRLNLARPRVWWPVHMGAQNLYDLEVEFDTGGRVSDRQTTRFGVREVTSELDAENRRVFKVNGRKILIRGGGWTPDMLLRYSTERMRAELQYVVDMNLNAVRQEGKLEPDEFYELTDRLGILVIAGWCCCDHWEHWEHRSDYKEGPTWDEEDYKVADQSRPGCPAHREPATDAPRRSPVAD